MRELSATTVLKVTMHAYLIAMGSLGDTLPFVHFGQVLAGRGHCVTLLANEHYREMIEGRGLGFESVLTRERYLTFIERREKGSAGESLEDMGRLVVEQIEPVHRLLCERFVPGETVVASQGYALGARVAQETAGIPLATVHLQPLCLRSALDMPPLPRWLPVFFKRGLQRGADLILDAAIGKPLMQYRQRFGLPPVKRAMHTWWNSPDRVLGFFPSWYSPPQADWPPNVELVGFPVLETAESGIDMSAVDEFLEAGDSPLVFSQSSIASDAHDYFETSLALAEKLDCRALFLTPLASSVPANLPACVRHFTFVPLERVLPRALAHVHHGGIGTIAQTIKAGIPQVTVSKIFDQPDNAARLARLGVSLNVKPKRYTPARVLGPLRRLLASDETKHQCEHYAALMQSERALDRAADLLEELVRQPLPRRTSS